MEEGNWQQNTGGEELVREKINKLKGIFNGVGVKDALEAFNEYVAKVPGRDEIAKIVKDYESARHNCEQKAALYEITKKLIPTGDGGNIDSYSDFLATSKSLDELKNEQARAKYVYDREIAKQKEINETLNETIRTQKMKIENCEKLRELQSDWRNPKKFYGDIDRAEITKKYEDKMNVQKAKNQERLKVIAQAHEADKQFRVMTAVQITSKENEKKCEERINELEKKYLEEKRAKEKEIMNENSEECTKKIDAVVTSLRKSFKKVKEAYKERCKVQKKDIEKRLEKVHSNSLNINTLAITLEMVEKCDKRIREHNKDNDDKCNAKLTILEKEKNDECEKMLGEKDDEHNKVLKSEKISFANTIRDSIEATKDEKDSECQLKLASQAKEIDKKNVMLNLKLAEDCEEKVENVRRSEAKAFDNVKYGIESAAKAKERKKCKIETKRMIENVNKIRTSECEKKILEKELEYENEMAKRERVYVQTQNDVKMAHEEELSEQKMKNVTYFRTKADALINGYVIIKDETDDSFQIRRVIGKKRNLS